MPEHIRKIEDRLEKGDRLCQRAKPADLPRLNAFWLQLLLEYEAAWKKCRGGN